MCSQSMNTPKINLLLILTFYISVYYQVLIFSQLGWFSRYYRVIALISANIVPSLDIEGRELASGRRYPNEGQYSPISVR